MIRLMSINNKERFLKMAKETRGDILINLPDGTTANLRNDHIARQMIRALPTSNADMRITLTDRSDLPMVLSFMMDDCA